MLCNTCFISCTSVIQLRSVYSVWFIEMQQTTWTIFCKYSDILTLFSCHPKLLDPIQKLNNCLPTTSRETFIVCSLTLILQAPLIYIQHFQWKRERQSVHKSNFQRLFGFFFLSPRGFWPVPFGLLTRGPPTVKGFKYLTF
jgi:hypothetical protein